METDHTLLSMPYRVSMVRGTRHNSLKEDDMYDHDEYQSYNYLDSNAMQKRIARLLDYQYVVSMLESAILTDGSLVSTKYDLVIREHSLSLHIDISPKVGGLD
jgi:hypothetical protein